MFAYCFCKVICDLRRLLYIGVGAARMMSGSSKVAYDALLAQQFDEIFWLRFEFDRELRPSLSDIFCGVINLKKSPPTSVSKYSRYAVSKSPLRLRLAIPALSNNSIDARKAAN